MKLLEGRRRPVWRAGDVDALGGVASADLTEYGSGTVNGYGEPWEDCVQSVELQIIGRRVRASATTRCKSRHDFLVPLVMLSGDQGKYGMVDKGNSCP
ncbi:hypothetical protein [Actinomadura logoneensis]|uniref:hypothetical protein n=1 Tax=Actinomadura logoneensis TaxID=2293572 RepID=UPI0011C0F08F|nr:hypothetical protein [Actinomadura logoneensis]